MQRSIIVISRLTAACAVVLALGAHFHPLIQPKLGSQVVWLDAIAAGLVGLVGAYEMWLRNLRLGKDGFTSRVPGHEGVCFYYWGPEGHMQSGRRLFGSVYYVSGAPFLGKVRGSVVQPLK